MTLHLCSSTVVCLSSIVYLVSFIGRVSTVQKVPMKVTAGHSLSWSYFSVYAVDTEGCLR